MQVTTLVSIATVLATVPFHVLATGYESSSSVTACETITAKTDAYGVFATCTVLACLEIKPVTQHCGCSTIPTITIAQTACPTSCGYTSYITAIEDCFPTSPPPYSSSSSSTSSLTSSSTPVYTTTTPPYNNPTSTTTPPYNNPTSTTTSQHTSSLPPVSYANSTITKSNTITKTETHVTTLTTCPASVKCTGQTVTYTSTEVCPTTTCTCVLPSVTYTTVLLGPNVTTITTSPQGNTPPSPTSVRPTFSQAGAAGRGSLEVGMGALGALVFGVIGLM